MKQQCTPEPADRDARRQARSDLAHRRLLTKRWSLSSEKVKVVKGGFLTHHIRDA